MTLVTLDELPGYLEMLAVRAGEAAIPGSNAMSDTLDKAVVAALTKLSHARGTRTPSAPGEPQAKESGDLAGSVLMVPATTPVVATSSVSPHMSPRDWVQEYGKVINARPGGRMVFYYGDLYRARRVKVPERSYMRSTVERLVADGSLTRAAAEAFYAAMWG